MTVSDYGTLIILPTYDTTIELPISLPDYIDITISNKGIAFQYLVNETDTELLMIASIINTSNLDQDLHTTVKKLSNDWQIVIIKQLDTNLSEEGKEKCKEFLDSINRWIWK